MKMIKTLGFALALASVMTLSTQAAYITGNLTISGGADLDNDDLNLATQVDAWSSPVVQSRTLDFTSVALNTAVTMTAPWTFNSGPHLGLWSVGGFTFDLTSSAVVTQAGGFLTVLGTGVISHASFWDTAGTFRFTTQEDDAGGEFSFSAANSTHGAVPDGGSTLVLLGSAIVGLYGIARKSVRIA